MKLRLLMALLAGSCCLYFALGQPAESLQARFRRMSDEVNARGLAEPYQGIFAGSAAPKDLFPLRATGVSTAPMRKAAVAFLATLSAEQKAKTNFPIDHDEWRKWMNQHFYVREGMSFAEMTAPQKEAAVALLRASLSAKGLQLTQDIRKLNHHLGELNNNDFVQYGEDAYWVTVMGNPGKADEPFGWQLDGHHAVINYFVLGDQVVMTPTFLGSEPVRARSGKYQGLTILQREQNDALALFASLTPTQRGKALLSGEKTKNNALTEAWHDNVRIDFAGLQGKEMTNAQREQLLALINLYISNMDDGHAKVKLSEVKQHLDQTWFAWIGKADPGSVFYYRIHSPVVLIEFDHQLPVGMRRVLQDTSVPFVDHIHTIVRTPNGNDYGKDLLRQHHARHAH